MRELKLEKIARLRKEYYRRNPLAWLKEVFDEDPKMFEWSKHKGYENHIWDGDKDPLAKAWQDIALGKWAALSSGTGVSKTFFVSRLVFWFLDVYDNSLVVTTAPSEPQLKLQVWLEIAKEFDKFKRRARCNSRLLTLSLHPEWFNNSPHCKSQRSHQAIGFTAGVSSNEDSAVKAQGLHRENMLIICDEAVGMAHAIMTAFQNTCTGTNNIIVALGNPDSENDELYKFAMLPYVSNYRVSAFDYPNVVLDTEIYKGAVTRTSIQRRRDKYGENSIMFQSRVRGITPTDADNSLVKRGWIDECWAYSDNCRSSWNDSYLSSVGIDVANSDNGDKAAVIWGRGNGVLGVREFYCPNASHIADNIMLSDSAIDSHNTKEAIATSQIIPNFYLPKAEDFEFSGHSIGIDAVGVGASTINTFLSYGLTPVSLHGGQWNEIIPCDDQNKPLYKFGNLRSQMFWELREDFRINDILIDVSVEIFEQIKKELMAIRFVLSAGTISIEAKEVIKKRLGGKSPNIADALAYWNWIRKRYRVSEETIYVNLYGGRNE